MNLHNSNKLEKEERALRIMLKDKTFRGYSLKEHRDRPDFIITNGHNDIAIEHCCVDTLCVKGKEHNSAILNNLTSKKLPDSLHRMIDANPTIKAIYEDRIDDFSSDVFGTLFFRIAMEHASKAYGDKTNNGYKKDLQVDKLGLLCEVPMPDFNYMWTVIDSDKNVYYQRIIGIPCTVLTAITVAMINSVFDFIVFVGMPNGSSKCSVQTYTVDSIKRHHIFSGFDFGEKNGIKVSEAFLDKESEC